VRGINAKGAAARYSRKGIDELTNFVVQDFGAKGLAWFKVEEGGVLASPREELHARATRQNRRGCRPGPATCCCSWPTVRRHVQRRRPKRFGEELKLYDPATKSYSWIVEFPMFAWDEESNCWAAMHHPFTAPRPQDLQFLTSDPGRCRAQAYDLVINGTEAGGGTIRIMIRSAATVRPAGHYAGTTA
jgi:aspartyl-tRNA synthetase